MVSSRIDNADGKVGILGAALAILGGTVVTKHGEVEAVFRDPGVRGIAALVFAAAGMVALCVAGVGLYSALKPRTPYHGRNRFSFSYLAVTSLDEVVTAATPNDIRREAWDQAKTLAGIALAKYRGFLLALRAGAAAALLFAVFTITLPS
ncbi:hypothetical protein [Frankia nepalensis]|uniref:Pycsar effector protein domain-containing protein n=1 Tax=Frankia nepalensis TaxID=1836974 RepID=A0A937UTB2_9ACTN|nr:hypothetical protein [Frankia nepalensis]MBL7512562.1 hypothetical protein [Frankia nepalensis]MBL7632923.1 hypothetical protein [Frankia nepalensis]